MPRFAASPCSSTSADSAQLSRDPAVELVRVIACLIVVARHVWLGPGDYADQTTRVFLNSLLADGVTVFWLLTGCFLFHNYSYRRTLIRTVRGILLPLIAFTFVVVFLVSDMIDGTFTFASIFRQGDTLVAYIKSFVAMEVPSDYLGHLWYLYSYILVMAASPALYGLVCWLEEAPPYREIGFLAASFLAFAWNDFTGNGLWEFDNYRLRGAIPAMIVVIWGHILYRHRDILCSRKRIPLFAAGFLGINALRSAWQISRYRHGSSNGNLMEWFTGFSLLCAACVLLFGLSLIRSKAATVKNRFICRAASYTFLIYMIHGVLINALEMINLRVTFYKWIAGFCPGRGMLSGVLYIIACTAAFTTMSLVIAILLKAIKRAIISACPAGKAGKEVHL